MDHQPPEEENREAEWPPDPPPGPDPDPDFYRRALGRIPRWIAGSAAVALPFVGWRMGVLGAASFVVGAIAGYWNFVAVRRIAERLSETVAKTGEAPRSRVRPGMRSLLRLLFIGVAAFVIIRFTHINLAAAFLGLFTPVAAVVMEILFELASRKT